MKPRTVKALLESINAVPTVDDTGQFRGHYKATFAVSILLNPEMFHREDPTGIFPQIAKASLDHMRELETRWRTIIKENEYD